MKTLFIYSFFLLAVLKSILISAQNDPACTQILKGEIRDRVADSLLQKAKAVLINKEGIIIASQSVREDATFSFKIQCNSEYKLEASMEDYTSEFKVFTTTNENNKELKLIVLLDKGKIELLSSPIVKKDLSTIKDNKAERVQLALLDNNEIVEDVKESIVENVKSELKNKKSVNNIENITIPPIYFDLGSSYFNVKAKRDLKKIVEILNNNRDIKLKLEANSDARGASDYNKWLSDRRAKRVIDYFLARGIKIYRITSKSYGDTQILNRCLKGVECTEEEHSQNRRVEFTVVNI